MADDPMGLLARLFAMAAQSAQPAQEDVYTVTIRNRMSVTVKDSNGNLVEGVELDKLIAKMTGQRSANLSELHPFVVPAAI